MPSFIKMSKTEFTVPAIYLGLIIGRGGETINRIKADFQVQIVADRSDVPDSNPPLRTISISGGSEDSREGAQSKILSLLPNVFTIPAIYLGLIIGRGGETINRIKADFQVQIVVDTSDVPDSNPPLRTISISGESGVSKEGAKSEILSLVSSTTSIHTFVENKGPAAKVIARWEAMSRDGTKPSIDAQDNRQFNFSALLYQAREGNMEAMEWLLSRQQPSDINMIGDYEVTALHLVLYSVDPAMVRLLLDNGADRSIKFMNGGRSAVEFARKIPQYSFENYSHENTQQIIEMLETYYPSEEQKLDAQFESHSRIEAVKSGDLDLLEESIPHVDLRLSLSLTMVAIEKDHLHLLDCLLGHIRPAIMQKSVVDRLLAEQNSRRILVMRLRTIRGNNSKVVNTVNNSLVLSLVDLFYHKFILLDFESLVDVMDTLKLEGLFEEYNLKYNLA